MNKHNALVVVIFATILIGGAVMFNRSNTAAAPTPKQENQSEIEQLKKKLIDSGEWTAKDLEFSSKEDLERLLGAQEE